MFKKKIKSISSFFSSAPGKSNPFIHWNEGPQCKMKGGNLQEDTSMHIFVATLIVQKPRLGFWFVLFTCFLSGNHLVSGQSKDVANFVAVEGCWRPRGGAYGPAGSSTPRAGETPRGSLAV